MTRTHTLFVLAVLALAAARPAHAQGVYFPADATINTTINNFVYVGYASSTDRANSANGTSPTVTLAPGGSIPFNSGAVSGILYAYNHSTVNVTGGSVGDSIYANNASTVTLTAGSVFHLAANASSAVRVAGGAVSGLDANAASTITITGGMVTNGLNAFDTSAVTLTGGTLRSLFATGHSAVNVAGGTLSNGLVAIDSSTVTITGGTFAPQTGFTDNTTGAFTFVGTGLSAVPLGPDGSGYLRYRLTGLLQDGHSLTDALISVNPTARMFTLVNAAPEPSQGAALALGALGLSTLTLRARRLRTGRGHTRTS